MTFDVAPPSALFRVYCAAMLLVGAFSGYLAWKNSNEAGAYETADVAARVSFGGADAPSILGARPTQFRVLCVGILQCIERRKQAGLTGQIPLDVPLERVRVRAMTMGLSAREWKPARAPDGSPTADFDESTLSVTFERTDLDHLTRFLYNVEQSSTAMRTLEIRWELLPASRDNDPTSSPGHLIDRPTVKIGQRFPRRIAPK